MIGLGAVVASEDVCYWTVFLQVHKHQAVLPVSETRTSISTSSIAHGHSQKACLQNTYDPQWLAGAETLSISLLADS